MKIFNRLSTKEKRRNLRKSETKAELRLWMRLKGKRFMGCKFLRQYGIGEYIVDFYCPRRKLVIEIDGSHHHSDDVRGYDKVREDYLCSLGIKIMRFNNLDILENIEGVLSQLGDELPLAPSLLKRGK